MPPKGIISWGTPKSVGILIDGQWHELAPVNDIPSLEPNNFTDQLTSIKTREYNFRLEAGDRLML